MYQIIRPLLFSLEPELAHRVAMTGLKAARRLGMRRSLRATKKRTVMGLEFDNPVGLAAGFDKNGSHIDALACLGFGFMEIGTITPRPQPGNPQPRLFRLPQAQALINRMGFNNDGVEVAVGHFERSRYDGVLGISIGKNSATPLAQAEEDYLVGLRRVYPYASYIAVNISSPGTKDLRRLQEPEHLSRLLGSLKDEQQRLADAQGKYVPLVVKVAPDFQHLDLRKVSEIVLAQGVDGIIATNTTLSRDGVEGLPHAHEQGGLSGAPLRERALQVLMELNTYVEGRIPLIASGGIMTADDALARIDAGASLVQVYTGLIYQGPRILKDIVSRVD